MTTTKTTTAKKADPMGIWNAVCVTDPANTKHINQRGGFTAIDAYSQILEATRLWGPMGDAWGPCVDRTTHKVVGGLWICDLYLRFPVSGITRPYSKVGCTEDRTGIIGPITGAKRLAARNGEDEDAPKKAFTDALTKALSYLGFNADVFLGKFDDNKYVASLQEKKANTDPISAASLFGGIDKMLPLLVAIDDARQPADRKGWKNKVRADVMTWAESIAVSQETTLTSAFLESLIESAKKQLKTLVDKKIKEASE